MGRQVVAALGLVLLLGGCAGTGAGSGAEGGTDGGVSAAPRASDGAGSSAATDLLAAQGIAARTGEQAVDELDAMALADRPTDLMASVRPDELVLSADGSEATLPLPEDRFYVSVAPWVDQTHECFHHSLTTCQGELADEVVDVRITTDDGEVLVDGSRTTWANGFVGFWLPRDVEGTLEVEHDGRTGRVDFATRADSPTCLTTLRLT